LFFFLGRPVQRAQLDILKTAFNRKSATIAMVSGLPTGSSCGPVAGMPHSTLAGMDPYFFLRARFLPFRAIHRVLAQYPGRIGRYEHDAKVSLYARLLPSAAAHPEIRHDRYRPVMVYCDWWNDAATVSSSFTLPEPVAAEDFDANFYRELLES
jgi:hypothetical protein